MTGAPDDWPWHRPATTIAGDSRVWPPGHKVNAADERAGRTGYGDRAGSRAIRVSVEDAARLQTFPDGYPFAGTSSSQRQQIGNAIPPQLALAILRVFEPDT